MNQKQTLAAVGKAFMFFFKLVFVDKQHARFVPLEVVFRIFNFIFDFFFVRAVFLYDVHFARVQVFGRVQRFLARQYHIDDFFFRHGVLHRVFHAAYASDRFPVSLRRAPAPDRIRLFKKERAKRDSRNAENSRIPPRSRYRHAAPFLLNIVKFFNVFRDFRVGVESVRRIKPFRDDSALFPEIGFTAAAQKHYVRFRIETFDIFEVKDFRSKRRRYVPP